MNFLVYSVDPIQKEFQINALKTTQKNNLAINFIYDIITQLIIDNNGKKHLQKAFIESVDILNNSEYKSGYYIITENNIKFSVYNKKITTKIQNGWLSSVCIDEVTISLYMTYHIVELPINNDTNDTLSKLTTSLMQSSIISHNEHNEMENTTDDKIEKQEITPTVADIDLDYTCYKIMDNKMCFKLSTECNGYCDEHNQLNNTNLITDKIVHKNCVIRTEKKFLNEIEDTCGRLNKVKTLKNHFDFLSLNRKFVKNHFNFNEVVISKLVEFNDILTKDERLIFDPVKYINFFNNPVDLEFMKAIDIDQLQNHITTLK